MGFGREPNVVSNANPTQIRHLQAIDGGAGLRVRLLGPMTITNAGSPIGIVHRKSRALLAYLALREGAEVSREVLIGLLWGERSEGQARASLRQALCELRAAFSGSGTHPIVATREVVKWVPGSAWIDAAVLAAARDSTDDAEMRVVAEVVGGELLEGLSVGEPGFDQWLRAERERFHLLTCSLHARLMDSAERHGNLEEVLVSGLKLLSLDPLQENVHRVLMRAYAAQGRSDAALAQYERCRRDLSEQLDVTPEPETQELARSIRASRREARTVTVAERQAASRPRPSMSAALPTRPSIAVLPFTSVGADEEGAYFAEGVADDIITELSRNRDLFVIARHSSFFIAQRESNPAAIGRALGVRHLLGGSIRRARDRLRLTLHLVECESGRDAWAERYDRRIEDLFDVQLEVARTVTATITGRLTALADDAIATKAPSSFVAYEHVLRAQQYLQRYTRADYGRAREHLHAAIHADPSYARPHGLLCLAGVYDWFWEMPEDGLAEVLETGQGALLLDDRDAKAHLGLAVAHLFAWQHDRALHHMDRAVALSPNDDLVVAEHARLLAATGRPEEGLGRVCEAMRLNPYHPNWYWNIEGLCLQIAAKYQEAIEAYSRIDHPHFWVEAYLAACQAMCGREERATHHRLRLFAARPDFGMSWFRRGLPVSSAPHLHRFLESFRRAGIKD
jgi:DNA-binding SARP family transcriptional activator/Tfp pilus assembly protein PilF